MDSPTSKASWDSDNPAPYVNPLRPSSKRSEVRYDDVDAKVSMGIGLGETVIEMDAIKGEEEPSPSGSIFTGLGTTAWMACTTALKEHDEAVVRAWKEEIDTLLVFAGLFSAVLTAFNIEAYKTLQPDTDRQTLQAVKDLPMAIAAALGSNSSTSVLIVDPQAARDFTPTHSAIVVNTLWFAALVCSLASASVSILVKQWLNQHTSGVGGSSPDAARIRQFRYDSLRKWRVGSIMMTLPILLQGSLVLFLVGLLVFLADLNDTASLSAVTLVCSLFVGVLLLFMVGTTVLPTIVVDCSYQSPQAWAFFVVFQMLKRPLRALCKRLVGHSHLAHTSTRPTARGWLSRSRKSLARHLAAFAHRRGTYSWKAREHALVETRGAQLDHSLLVRADATFPDDRFLHAVVRPCLASMPPDAALRSYTAVLAHRADLFVDGLPAFEPARKRPATLVLLADLTLDMLRATASLGADQLRFLLRMLKHLLPHTLRETYPRACRVLFGLLDHRDAPLRSHAFVLLNHQLVNNPALSAQFAPSGCHDLPALAVYVARARADDLQKQFLDACNLVVSLSAYTPTPQTNAALCATLAHLTGFFETPLWWMDRQLIFPVARLFPHLAALARRDPGLLLEDGGRLLGALADVATALEGVNEEEGGNWEDKVQVVRDAARELEMLRAAAGKAPSSTVAGDSSSNSRPPSARGREDSTGPMWSPMRNRSASAVASLDMKQGISWDPIRVR